ncbi:calcium/sodium antiporter [Gallaecimonas mangrovi]|uniref:calcium/sodium antiporter n=1 Tax=Gallaecimonas mangrovi TaxID=2291597 RepID=UPI000E1FED69|nr:calcium/sodium antiporter [Gallaecimonas mangrovi]
MLLAILAILGGLVVLVWSADRFVDGAASTARYAGMPPLLIGMVVVGFGTSAPEMVVSALAALDGNPDLALGNAYGSNITNIALILGLVAMLSPIAVQSQVLKKELPVLVAVTLLSGALLLDGELTRLDAVILLVVFAFLMGWTIVQGLRQRGDIVGNDINQDLDSQPMSLKWAIFWLVFGLVLLVLSSRVLVWGAVNIAHHLGVSDLVIGLTIVAIGTSLPELASSIVAVRKNEHDLALGNVIGSNLFNTLTVVGIAAAIKPMKVDPEVLHRDWLVMMVLTVLLLVMGYGFKRQGRINRVEGAILLLIYLGYSGYLATSIIH